MVSDIVAGGLVGQLSTPNFCVPDNFLLIGKFFEKKESTGRQFSTSNSETLAGLSRVKLYLSVF